MKIFNVFAIILFITVTVSAQNIKLPGSVTSTFDKLYPNAVNVKWDKEGNDEFEASFAKGTQHLSVVIDEDGKLLETETAIAINELSTPIQHFISKNYSGYKITEAAKIVDYKGRVMLEAEVTKANEKKDLLFDQHGKPIVKTKTKEGDGKDQDEED